MSEKSRILYVNWAPLWLGAELGGGVNLYQQQVAAEMVRRGHEVHSLSAGWEYSLASGAYFKRGPDYAGVVNYILVNAPNLAPGFFNFEDPLSDVREPQSEALFQRLLKEIAPDVVHFNNVEGISAHCIEIARESGARVIYSLHNYHALCNQVYLLHQDKEICKDFRGGDRCLDCIAPPPKRAEKRVRCGRRLADAVSPDAAMRDTFRDLYRSLKSFLMGLRAVRPALVSFRDRSLSRRRSLLNLPERPSTDRPAVRGEAPPPGSGQSYAERRAGFVQAINCADVVLAVSTWVREVFVEMRVEGEKIEVRHIGTPIADQAPLPRTSPVPMEPGDAVHIAFLGLASPPKGLPFLLQTLASLGDELLARVHLHVYARGVSECASALDRLAGRLGSLEVCDGYRYEEIPKLLQNMDLGVVPPIWWDNAPQVVFEMLAMKVPVIAARVGGIPDFVFDETNGLLFHPGDSADLLDKVRRVVENPELIEKLKGGISPMKRVTTHANELEEIYGPGS